MIERSRAAFGIQLANSGDCFVNVLTGNETGCESFEEPKTSGKVLQSFLARKVDECASGNHIFAEGFYQKREQ
jgi:hypothetical protein